MYFTLEPGHLIYLCLIEALVLSASRHRVPMARPGGALQGGLVSTVLGVHFVHRSKYLARARLGILEDVYHASGTVSEEASSECSGNIIPDQSALLSHANQ